MTSNYLVWEHAIVEGACSLDSMKGYEDDWKLQAGLRHDGGLPQSAHFQFSPDDRKGVALTDSLSNLDRLIVASPRLRTLLESAQVPEVEFLPVRVLDHRKRPVAQPFCIVNLLAPVDCLVLEECEPRWSRLDKTQIARVKRLVVDEARIDSSRSLFRIKSFPACTLVHRRLAQRIDSEGLTGTRWVELANYPEV